MPERAADDFTIIRERLEQIRKEQEEALKNPPQEKTEEQMHQEVYGEFCNGNSKEHTLKAAIATANAAVGAYYYDELMLDAEDNEIQYHKPDCKFQGIKLPKAVYVGCQCDKYLPNRVLP